MFYVGWILLTALGIGASVAAFFWALRSGQFLEQGRARYLPLRDEIAEPALAPPLRRPKELYAMAFALGVGLLGMAGTVALSLLRGKG